MLSQYTEEVRYENDIICPHCHHDLLRHWGWEADRSCLHCGYRLVTREAWDIVGSDKIERGPRLRVEV